MSRHKKVVKIPVHYLITENKINKLNKVTARLTTGAHLFSDIIQSTKKITRKDLAEYEKEIAKKTKLSSGFVQQCKDKAIWVNRSYNRLHKSWKARLKRSEAKLKKSKKHERYHLKLLKREPSKPFSKSTKKMSSRLDNRTCDLRTNLQLKGPLIKATKEQKNISLLWLNVSTLKKGDRMMIPLNPSVYHINELNKANKIIDCELVKKKHKWYVHVTCEYEITFLSIDKIRAIDLGIARSMTTVLLSLDKSPLRNSSLIVKDGIKKFKLHKLDHYLAKLQRLKKWNAVKRIREKIRNFKEDQERKLAESIARKSKNCLVRVGYPKGLKYRSFKGNNKRRLRSKLQKWTYSRIIGYIEQSCTEKGIEVLKVNEYLSSKTCSRCQSKDTQRPYQSSYAWFKCNSCAYIINADINGAINIGRDLASKHASSQRAKMSRPEPGMIIFRGYEPGSSST